MQHHLIGRIFSSLETSCECAAGCFVSYDLLKMVNKLNYITFDVSFRIYDPNYDGRAR